MPQSILGRSRSCRRRFEGYRLFNDQFARGQGYAVRDTRFQGDSLYVAERGSFSRGDLIGIVFARAAGLIKDPFR